MKKKIIALICIVVVIATSLTFVACDFDFSIFGKQLATPQVTINGDGVASRQSQRSRCDFELQSFKQRNRQQSCRALLLDRLANVG